MAGWRTIVITERCKLDVRYNNMNIRKKDELNIVNISEIAVLIIESTAVSLTTSLLSELSKNKVKIIFCDEFHNPESELIPYYGSYDCSERVKKQFQWYEDFKENVWTLIVYEKIKKQMENLKYLNKEQSDLLFKYMNEIEHFDVTNREGHAAKVYFNSLFGKKFSRENMNDKINKALNYGYAILLSSFNREIVLNGYLTNLGIFHKNKFNPFNLSCDIMEPFRPIVDKKVYFMEFEDFKTEEKRQVQSILKEPIYINKKKYYLLDAIKIYTKSILDALDNNDISLIRFYENEL